MARRGIVSDWIQGQLELPREIVDQFMLPCRGWGKNREIEPEYRAVTILPTYRATGKNTSTKYRPVHWHDWMKERTKPWRREPDRDIAWLLAEQKKNPAKYVFGYDVIPEEVTA